MLFKINSNYYICILYNKDINCYLKLNIISIDLKN